MRPRRSRWCMRSPGTSPRPSIAWPKAPCRRPAPDEDVGRNSFFRDGWLPPDPPTGHGSHDYVFQMFALAAPITLDGQPGRGALVDAIAGQVVAAGVLVGTYSRGEPAPTGLDTGLNPALPA